MISDKLSDLLADMEERYGMPKYLPIRQLKTTRDWCWKWVPDISKI